MLFKYIANTLGCFIGLPKGVVWKKLKTKHLLFPAGKAEYAGAVALAFAFPRGIYLFRGYTAESAMGITYGEVTVPTNRSIMCNNLEIFLVGRSQTSFLPISKSLETLRSCGF
jgi:hypothetical protein